MVGKNGRLSNIPPSENNTSVLPRPGRTSASCRGEKTTGNALELRPAFRKSYDPVEDKSRGSNRARRLLRSEVVLKKEIDALPPSFPSWYGCSVSSRISA